MAKKLAQILDGEIIELLLGWSAVLIFGIVLVAIQQ